MKQKIAKTKRESVSLSFYYNVGERETALPAPAILHRGLRKDFSILGRGTRLTAQSHYIQFHDSNLDDSNLNNVDPLL